MATNLSQPQRRRRSRWLGLVLFLATLGLNGIIVVSWTTEQQPSYQGKTLSQWLRNEDPDFVWLPTDVYGHIHDELWDQLIHRAPNTGVRILATPLLSDPRSEALRQIGTNAVPWLLRWMNVRDTALDWGLVHFSNRLPAVVRNLLPYLPEVGWSGRAGRWNIAAFDGFVLLGTNVAYALPALSEPIKHGELGLPRAWAIASLGPAGIACLSQVLQSTNRGSVDDAALALGMEGEAARAALPALLDAVEHGRASYHVLGAIGRIDPRQPRLVPALLRLLEASPPPGPADFDETMALLLLGLQGEGAAPAIPLLQRKFAAEQSPNAVHWRRLLRRVILAIEPAAAATVPLPDSEVDGDEWP